jgi:TatA/E family protein of Tat protein translocase
MPFNIGAPELIIILIIALVLLGPGRLPDVAQSLGRSVREFRKAATDLSDATSLEAKPGTAGTGAAPAAPSQAQPNTLTGSTPPNTLEGSDASPASSDGDETRPAA